MTGMALIILASGMSRRFHGGNKLLADLNGKPVARYVIDAAANLNFQARYAVICDKKVQEIFDAHGFTCIHNESPQSGQGSSLALGVRQALEDEWVSALIMLADMPFVTADHIQTLTHASGDIIMSEYENRLMPPSRFSGPPLKALMSLTGDSGGKSAVNRADVTTIALSQSAARDIDTREDLDNAI